MAVKLADYRPKGIKTGAGAQGAYSSLYDRSGVIRVSLGTPATLDANGILATASATSTAQTYTASDFAAAYDSTAGLSGNFGRTIYATGTAGSNHVITISGYDYQGRPMQESITLNDPETEGYAL